VEDTAAAIFYQEKLQYCHCTGGCCC